MSTHLVCDITSHSLHVCHSFSRKIRVVEPERKFTFVCEEVSVSSICCNCSAFERTYSPFCSKFHEGMMMTMTMILYYGGGYVMGARQCEFKYYVTFLFSTYLCTLKNIINIKYTEKDAQSGRK